MPGSIAEGAVEMILQMTANFTFQGVFEQAQHESEFGKDMNLLTVNSNGSCDTSPLEVNGVIFPAIVDGKFFGQILGQLVSCFLSVFTAHPVPGVYVNFGHLFYYLLLAVSSLVPAAFCSQPVAIPEV